MLVISRKVGEEIVLPDLGITIRIAKSTPSRASLAIDAPADVQISRMGGSADAAGPKPYSVPSSDAANVATSELPTDTVRESFAGYATSVAAQAA